MQDDFKETKLIIIDEYNMLGRAMLSNVDLRCRNIFSADEPFGDVSILVVGTMRQLPPVFDSPLYARNGSQILDNGASTMDDWKLFQTRDWSMLTIQEKANFKNVLHLFPTKVATNEYNLARLIKTGRLVARMPSTDNYAAASTASSDNAKGLEKNLYLSVGARVMLRSNLTTQYRLVNGAVGIVVDIVYSSSTKLPNDLPLAVMVDFDNYSGKNFREGTNIIPVPPQTINWKTSSVCGAKCTAIRGETVGTNVSLSNTSSLMSCALDLDASFLLIGVDKDSLIRKTPAVCLAEKAMSVPGPVVPTKEGGGVDQERLDCFVRLVAMLADLGQKGGMLRLVGKVALLWGGIRSAISLIERLILFLHLAERPLFQRILGFACMVLVLWSPVVIPLFPTLVQGSVPRNSTGIAEYACIAGLYSAVTILMG
ncbi:hypothetical protein GIB67_005043 [Kingdonia uniflora]|uniref:ATP-dependent DNA helicase n=1 Tax=Kingdonia uniflora TaxID=39325 RepID=A0A7J7NMN6_9MAGN|nr:hypothetical protein GIB67_005043 [Kingdonia uniflora]